jgi:hypothetical protein
MRINTCTMEHRTCPGVVEAAVVRLRTLRKLLGLALLGLCHIAAPALGQGALENPQPRHFRFLRLPNILARVIRVVSGTCIRSICLLPQNNAERLASM